MRHNWDQTCWTAVVRIEEDPSIAGVRAGVHITRHRNPDLFGAGTAVHAANDPDGYVAEDLATARALTDIAAQLRTRHARSILVQHDAPTPARVARSAVPV